MKHHFPPPRRRERPRALTIISLSIAIVLCQQPSSSFQLQASSRMFELQTGPRYLIRQRQDPIIVTKRHAGVATLSSNANNRIPSSPLHLDDQEQQERRELQWLVKTTSRLLREESPSSSSALLKKYSIRQAQLAMQYWADRTDCKKGSNAPYVVEKILSRLVQERDKGNSNVVITTKMYNIIIEAWSKSDLTDLAAQRAEEILVQMERLFRLGNPNVQPDYDSYMGVMKAMVKNESDVSQIQALVNRMKQNGISSRRRGYNLLLYALANCKHETSDYVAEQALAIMQTMKDEYHESDCEQSRPNTNTYNQVLSALARRRGFENKAQQVFDEMLESPDMEQNTDTFNAILNCWLKSQDKNALEQMKDIVRIMKERQVSADVVTANTMLAAHAKSRDVSLETTIAFYDNMDRDYNVSPNTVSNNILIDCWSKSGRTDAPEQVLELLDRMETDFKQGNLSVKPDPCTYASVIDCIAKCGRSDIGERAEALVERMRDLHGNHGGDAPTTPVLNACLNAWATQSKNNDTQAVDRAESILQEMEEFHSTNGSVPAPDKLTYNTVLKAMSRSGNHALRAEALLTRLEEQAKRDNSLAPDSYSYTSVITAFARSRIPDKAAKSLVILQRMIDSYENGNLEAKPRIHAFNACLNACAFTTSRIDQHQMEAFLITVSIILLLQKYSKPDSLTYSTVLRACSRLLARDDERRDFISQSIFNRACREGQVDKMVIEQLKFAASSDLYHKSLAGIARADNSNVQMRDLPRDWTCRVRQQYRKVR